MSGRLHTRFSLGSRLVTAPSNTLIQSPRRLTIITPQLRDGWLQRTFQTKCPMAQQQPTKADWEELMRRNEAMAAAQEAQAIARFPNFYNNNTVVALKRYLEEDGHRIWGPVIYRCTYEDDAAWEILVERMRSANRKNLDSAASRLPQNHPARLHGAEEIWESFQLTVLQDRTLFNGASPATIREHFQNWAKTVPAQEQPPGAGPGEAGRYQFCIMVDKSALKSVTKDDGESPYAFVNLVSKDLVHVAAEYEDDMDPNEEMCDGVALGDWNWMRVSYSGALTYSLGPLRNISFMWENCYVPPPEIAPGL